MMGVIANPAEECAVREFFELFKIPWEFYRSDRRYDTVLCAGDAKLDGIAARLLLSYSGKKTSFDAEQEVLVNPRRRGSSFSYAGTRLPIYGDSATFPHQGTGILEDESSGEHAAYVARCGDRAFARIGYDLFCEVDTLLTQGQPPANAGIPALELHIALLRDLITGCSIPVVEIPPVPDGYPFIACLTHDIDHPSIRRHLGDQTMIGFLYRATLGSVVNVGRGRLPLRKLFTNWAAVAKLPFVYLGLVKDFWCEFDRYLDIEGGQPSTFFVIPLKNYPGQTPHGPAPRRRASRYAASDVEGLIRKLMSAGCEVALQGIDAWLDSSAGREELERIRRITGMSDIGVRMHWLYADEQSPVILERAGVDYDSTMGYNEAVGYRAGTNQAYKPLQASRLLELPLHVMDTALFYPGRLNLSPGQARSRVREIVDNAVRFGGSVTVNWHDRSIAPERLWDGFYTSLVQELKSKRPWFSTASQAVSWFRKRRSAVIETVRCEPGGLHTKVSVRLRDQLPGLRLRIHKPRGQRQLAVLGIPATSDYVDFALNGSIDTRIAI